MNPPPDSRLRALIAACGPIPVATYMHYCLFHRDLGYYTRGAGIGRDFTTAPEISQVFGELIGLWCVSQWNNLGKPDPWYWVELGPGRGTLAHDALRAIKVDPECAHAMLPVLVETSAALRQTQKKTLTALSDTRWVETVTDIPHGPALIVANEFLDCMPVRRLVRDNDRWREQMVGLDSSGRLTFGLGSVVPDPPDPSGDVVETSPAALGVARDLAQHVCSHSGRVLLIDYGYGPGETPADEFRGFRNGRKCHPIDAIDGNSDLTADVDFGAIAQTAANAGARVDGPITQRDFLCRIGVRERAGRLLQSVSPDRVRSLAEGVDRLIAPNGMGTAFRVLAFSSPELGPPAGFDAP